MSKNALETTSGLSFEERKKNLALEKKEERKLEKRQWRERRDEDWEARGREWWQETLRLYDHDERDLDSIRDSSVRTTSQ
jgi:hypothetical protein